MKANEDGVPPGNGEGIKSRTTIVVDDVCVLDRPTGIEVYTRALGDYLGDAFSSQANVLRLSQLCNLANSLIKTKMARWLLLQPIAISRAEADVFVFANFPPSPISALLIWLRRGRIVRVIHDTVPWELPEFTTKKTICIFRRLDNWFISMYSNVLTVSQYSERSLKRIFCKYASKIRNGGQLFKAVDARVVGRDIASVIGDECKFFLHVGTLEPRKNLETILSALAHCSRSDFKIVVAGRAGWGGVDYRDVAKDLRVTDRVIFLDYVDEAALASLYNEALGLLLPSHYEGFGMPIVEAMAHGLPILAAKNSAITEVVGSAGELIVTTDVGAWTAAMLKVAEDEVYRHAMRRSSEVRFVEIITEQRDKINATWAGILGGWTSAA